MQLRWLVVVAAASAQVRAEPSRTLEHAVKLYDRADYWSATIEFQRVDSGEAGDDGPNRERAKFFLAKSLYQIGFYVPALVLFDRLIDDDEEHQYREAALKWILSVADKVPGAGPGALVFRYPRRAELADRFESSRDAFSYELGRELARRDKLEEAEQQLTAVGTGSKYGPRAALALERVLFRRRKVRAAMDEALAAARDPALASDATRELAAWTRRLGESVKAITALRTIAQTESPAGALATLELSRLAVEDIGGVPGLPKLPSASFDAVVVATTCRVGASEDILTASTATIKTARGAIAKLLGFDDNTELYEAVETGLRGSSSEPAVIAIRNWLDDIDLREDVTWVSEITREIDQLRVADRAWQTTMVASEALQELTVQQSVAAADAGKVMRERLKLLDRELAQMAEVFAQPIAIPAGPSIATGKGFAVTEVACHGPRGTSPAPAVLAAPQGHGCPGCASGDGGGLIVIAFAIALRPRRRAQ